MEAAEGGCGVQGGKKISRVEGKGGGVKRRRDLMSEEGGLRVVRRIMVFELGTMGKEEKGRGDKRWERGGRR